ncbi:CPBP family intramembrane metalloprotease [candidate division WOR-3 bacterium]|nr:CPBP family intramembrane metalloprotease [candidate division WOR-3 bacterium]
MYIIFLIFELINFHSVLTFQDSLLTEAKHNINSNNEIKVKEIGQLWNVVLKYPDSKYAKKTLRLIIKYYEDKKQYGLAGRYLEDFYLRYPEDTLSINALYNAGVMYEKEEQYFEAIRIYNKVQKEYPQTEYAEKSWYSIKFLEFLVVVRSRLSGEILWRISQLIMGSIFYGDRFRYFAENTYFRFFEIFIFFIILGLSYTVYIGRKTHKKYKFWSRKDTGFLLYSLLTLFLFIILVIPDCEFLFGCFRKHTNLFQHLFLMIFAFFIFCWVQEGAKDFFYISPKKIGITISILIIGGIIVLLIPIIDIFLDKFGLSFYPIVKFKLYRGAVPSELTVLGIIQGCICAPFCEELVYRGILYNSIKEKNGKLYAIILSSLLWGILHTFNNNHFILSFAYGIILSIIFEKTRSISASILAHSCINTVIYFISLNW